MPAWVPDLVAFSAAYRDHGDAVFRHASLICGRTLAEDVSQEVFVELWRHPERFDSTRGTLRTYLATMAHNKAIDAVRSEDSRRSREAKNAPSETSGGGDDIDLGLVRSDETARIAEAVRGLPPVERDALVVAFFGRCSYRQAAVVLQEAEGTVKSRIRSGLRRLGVALSEAPSAS